MSILWNITPYNPFKIEILFGGKCHLDLRVRRISEARNKHEVSKQNKVPCFSETLVDLQRISRPYIPEDRTLHNHGCESLRSYNSHIYQPFP
jgi:hypothetical protein